MTTWGLVMAAGQGSRMGGPKALLAWRGVPLAVAHARALRSVCDEVVVVVRAPVAQKLPNVRRTRVVASDMDDDLGPAGSIAAAVASGAFHRDDLVLVTPVDVPPVAGPTAHALIATLQRGAVAVRPRCDGRRGHPIGCRGSVLLDAYGSGRFPPLRDVLHALGSACVDIELDDPDVTIDLNTPDGYRARAGQDPWFT